MKDYTRTPESTRNINREPKASKHTSMVDYLTTQHKEILQRKDLEEGELLQDKFETVQREDIVYLKLSRLENSHTFRYFRMLTGNQLLSRRN